VEGEGLRVGMGLMGEGPVKLGVVGGVIMPGFENIYRQCL
jgi:hypothetical protein